MHDENNLIDKKIHELDKKDISENFHFNTIDFQNRKNSTNFNKINMENIECKNL